MAEELSQDALDAIQRFLARNNEVLFGRNLRRYQRDLYIRGAFAPEGLLQDFACTFLGTVTFANKAYAWRFYSARLEVDFWVLSSLCNEGYLLEGVYIARSRTFIGLAGRSFDNPAQQHQLSVCRRYKDGGRAASLESPRPSRVVLRVGHDNYAHFMWNELPALILCEQYISHAGLEVVVINEPIAALEALWYVPPDAPLTKASQQHYIPLDDSLYPFVIFSVGGSAVTQAAKQRIIAACLQLETDSGMAFQKTGAWVIWVSLRVTFRHAVNLDEALLALVRRLGSMEGTFDLLLDGWSVPGDLIASERYNVEAMMANQIAVQAEAARLVSLTREMGLSNVVLHDFTAASTPVSMSLARHADFYICHGGTQQHKIGWLYDVPGIIHTNVHLSRSFSPVWTADMALSEQIPALIPVAILEDAVTTNRFQNEPARRDYRITDLDAFVDLVIEHLERARGRSPPGEHPARALA